MNKLLVYVVDIVMLTQSKFISPIFPSPNNISCLELAAACISACILLVMQHFVLLASTFV
jgi:hypothetical protein